MPWAGWSDPASRDRPMQPFQGLRHRSHHTKGSRTHAVAANSAKNSRALVGGATNEETDANDPRAD